MKGRRVAAVHTGAKGLRSPFARDFKRRLTGAKVLSCGRRAKYLLIGLDTGDTLVLHLGMSGRVTIIDPDKSYKKGRHDHLTLIFDNGCRIVLNDPRRFGMAFVEQTARLNDYPAFRVLGPEPLAPGFTGKKLVAALAERSAPMKNILMDQRIVAGLGNIYVCEALFYAGISPLRPAGQVSVVEASRLVSAIKKVLRAALKAGGSSLRDYRHADGSPGYFQTKLAVYDREGQACPGCRCDISRTGGIRRIAQGGRSTFYCPRRQT